MISLLLNNYLSREINPNSNIINQASESQERLRVVLANRLLGDAELPFLLDGEDFLFGSSVRGTKQAPFDDIDLMLVLDGSLLVPIENGETVGAVHGSGRNYNPLLSHYYLDDSGLISSQKVLNKIRSVVDGTYPRSEIRKDGQAVNVWMDSYGFGVDIVPAFKINHRTAGVHYYIPSGSNSDSWQSTNPWSDIYAFKQEDIRLAGLLTMTSRLMRKWNELSNGKRLSGFHIDTMVYRSLLGKYVPTLESAVSICFDSFDDLLSQPCPQFSGFTPHIDYRLDALSRTRSRNAVQSAKNKIQLAALNRLLGRTDFPAIWDELFGGKLIV